ncbi:MAG: peptide-methionine (S)-S-oxide reductase MsrA [Proteobacteria bacterium]|nr:peptide-methionine (S)-S-oxide reductase MsrA [Pseudomonadota bacterium]
MSSTTIASGARSPARKLLPAVLLAGAAVALFTLVAGSRARAEEARVLPAPAAAAQAAGPDPGVAVLAGGCFWGVQGVFQHLRGVTRVESGYAGGARDTAQYERVSDGDTGHAESVRIQYDPRQISFAQLLQVYFSVAHDPTELNRQGPDTGTQYRSEVFAQNPQQAEAARAYILQLDAAHAFPRPIVTRVETGKPFFPAESYHQDFLTRNPHNPYIAINDLPKVANLQRLFPTLYTPTPVLVYPEH